MECGRAGAAAVGGGLVGTGPAGCAARASAVSEPDWSRDASPSSEVSSMALGACAASLAVAAAAAAGLVGRLAAKSCPPVAPPLRAAVASSSRLEVLRRALLARVPRLSGGEPPAAAQAAERARQARLASEAQCAAAAGGGAPGPARAGAGPLSWAVLQRRAAALGMPSAKKEEETVVRSDARVSGPVAPRTTPKVKKLKKEAAKAAVAAQQPVATRKRPAAAGAVPVAGGQPKQRPLKQRPLRQRDHARSHGCA